MFADITSKDNEVFCYQFQFDGFFFSHGRLIVFSAFSCHLQTHLVHPLLFLKLTTFCFNIHTIFQMLHIPFTPQESYACDYQHVE